MTNKQKVKELTDKVDALEYNARFFHTEINKINSGQESLMIVTGSLMAIILGIAIYKTATN